MSTPRSRSVPACARRDPDRLRAGLGVGAARAISAARAAHLLSRSIVWNDRGLLEPLGARAPLCVNPLLGAATDVEAPARLNLGAANATGLEWGARPGFLGRQVAAQCDGRHPAGHRPRARRRCARPATGSSGCASRRSTCSGPIWRPTRRPGSSAWRGRGHPASLRRAPARQSNSSCSTRPARWPRSEVEARDRAARISRASSAATAIRSRCATGSASL